MGALNIPIGTYHRSQSGKEGSIVLNQATRDEVFDPKTEFTPVSLRHNKKLEESRKTCPVYWIWDKNKIQRVKVNSENCLKEMKLMNLIHGYQSKETNIAE